MRNIKKILSLFLLISIIFGCEEEVKGPQEGGNPPGPVTNVEVENIAGGAIINYTLPSDANLLYVKAVYERNSEPVEAKASYFTNNVLVEGLGDTHERDVQLYAVSRGEKASEPVTVKINPLSPPIADVMGSLDIRESFGGMNVNFENPASTQARPVDIVIGVLMWDPALNEWLDVDAYYTGLPGGSFSVRGLDPVEKKFGFLVRDIWGNSTDTLTKVMTPIYEEEIDGSTIKDVRGNYDIPQMAPFPSDGSEIEELEDYSGSWRWNELFDKETGNNGWHTKEKRNQPAWMPFDLGEKIRLSRYKIWQRMHDNNSTYFYSHGNPHEWEIWGTNTPQDPDSWVRLDHRIMQKPSGLPLGQVSNDDVEIARAGHEYEFSLDTPAVRYIAWKHIDSWASIDGATGFVHMSEMRLWGQIQ